MNIVILITLFLLAPIAINAQCVHTSAADPCVLINQSVLDRTAKALDEIPKLRDLVTKYEAQVKLTDAERLAAQGLIAALNAVIDVRGKMIADLESFQIKMFAAYEKVIAMQQALIDKLTADLNRPKSGWKKFVQAIREIGFILAGVSLGRLL